MPKIVKKNNLISSENSRKKDFNLNEAELAKISAEALVEQLKKAVKGLNYVSEVDSEVDVFTGVKAAKVNKSVIFNQTKTSTNTFIEEINFADFFCHLTKISDWFSLDEIEIAEKFSVLRDLLERNLEQLKIFKLGRTRIKIYIVGLHSDGILMGIQTNSLET